MPEPPASSPRLIAAATRARPYRRRPGDPLHRPLRIFTCDPETSRLDGGIALVKVPYEPLRPGPRGALFEVVDDDPDADDVEPATEAAGPVALDSRRVLIASGRPPSGSDPHFRQQMVYAVACLVYDVFRRALGRDVGWGFDGPRLRLRTRGQAGLNACYDASLQEIRFGYQDVTRVLGSPAEPLKPGVVYSCLSHDVIAHEVTHALVDGLRAKFRVATGPDVPAFHEALADIVALLNRFSQREFVRVALRASHGRLLESGALTGFARELGSAAKGRDEPLRWATDTAEQPSQYGQSDDPYARGSVLVNAVYEVFDTLLGRKMARYIRLATGGLGILPRGDLPYELAEILTEEASKIAGQLLNMCVRAIDYCPPVDLELGEYLRAVITADRDLVADDPWGYREAWIQAFRRRRIYPWGVKSLGEDALVWDAPEKPVRAPGLTYSRLRFSGDPARAPSLAIVRAQAKEVEKLVREAGQAARLGLLASAPDVDPPRVESVRTSRRVGPDGQVVFDLVAEVTQRRFVTVAGQTAPMAFFGGCTLIIGPDGYVRYSIRKDIDSTHRPPQQARYVAGAGRRFWATGEGPTVPLPNVFGLLDDPKVEDR